MFRKLFTLTLFSFVFLQTSHAQRVEGVFHICQSDDAGCISDLVVDNKMVALGASDPHISTALLPFNLRCVAVEANPANVSSVSNYRIAQGFGATHVYGACNGGGSNLCGTLFRQAEVKEVIFVHTQKTYTVVPDNSNVALALANIPPGQTFNACLDGVKYQQNGQQFIRVSKVTFGQDGTDSVVMSIVQ